MSLTRVRRLSSLRPTILATMLVVALIAVGLGMWRSKMVADARARQFAVLKSDLLRAADRVSWSERMRQKGYMSAAQVAADRWSLECARSRLEAFEGR